MDNEDISLKRRIQIFLKVLGVAWQVRSKQYWAFILALH